ncbi:MAG: hypothetical protein MJ216_01800 [Bacilli bacterium]|nr:hypothetical protein [Bacilli bacterium]
MAGNDLAMRFTEDKYATKNEVARELKITSVDTFWANILAYRSNFYHYLTVRTIEKNMLLFCGCPAINSLVNNLEMKLIRVNREYGMLSPQTRGYRAIKQNFERKILNVLNEVEQLQVGDDFLDSVLRKEVVSAIPNNMLLVNYVNALNYIKTAYVNQIDEDFLANLYSKLLGTEELTEFYRSSEDHNPENRVLINRVYTSAPYNLIDSMMNNLFTFISSSALSSSLKAIVVYFYINYVKPFSKYSEEMAVLMAKAILAHEAFGDTVVDLPIEQLMTLSSEEVARIYVEVQKTADITYFVNYAAKHLSQYFDNFLDEIAKNKVNEMRQDFYKVDDEQKEVEVEEDKIEKIETVDLFESNNEDEQEIEETNDTDDAQPVLSSESETVIEQPKKKTVKVTYIQEELAVAYIPVALDEKQAVLLEQDLLERDPELKKGEAKFYARHCTKGKKYTIAQYKKSLKCAYETARTSMDHLAELLYYRKEKIKNKYVYIPVEKE